MRWLPFTLLFAACATTSPRFSQDVAATFAEEQMRHLVTADVDLYYPARYREAALEVAARASECLTSLRAHVKRQRPRGRALLFLTPANFNNAYVSGQSNGEPLHSVNPLFATSEYFPANGLGGADTGDIACHEMLHYAHFEQIDGLWNWVNQIVGPVVPAQWFLERWYMEGVAEYYEGRIRKRVGRPSAPLYRAMFDSYVAKRGGRLNGGDLSPWHRELTPASGAYLTSAFFVEWLVERFGEDKLWEVMELQGKSLFSPLGVTLRFKAVYGKSVGALLDEWSDELAARPVRQRRPDQQVLRDQLGQWARLAAHAPTGTLALLTEGNDEPATLRLLERDGKVRVETRLQRFGTDREWVSSGPAGASGLSFSADGRFLFLLNDDLTSRGDSEGQLWKVDARTGEVLQVRHGLGPTLGGAVHPDGARYTVVAFSPGQARLVDVDLATGAMTPLETLPRGASAAGLDWSPDGARLVYSRFQGRGWDLMLREADGTTRALTHDGAFNFGARWVDEHTVVFVRTAGDRSSEGSGPSIPPEPTRGPGEATAAPSAPPERSREPSEATAASSVPPERSRGAGEATASGSTSLTTNDRLQVHRLDVDSGRLERLSDVPWGLFDAAPLGDAVAVLNRSGSQWSLDVLPAQPLEALALAPAAAPTPAADAPPALVITSDEPYSPVDHLFLPELRTPLADLATSVAADGTVRYGATVGASLAGRDRLSRHAWSLSGTVTLPTLENWQQLSYSNQQLAPWSLSASLSRTALPGEVSWDGRASASRSVFTVPVSLAFETLVWQPAGQRAQQFLGPRASASWGSVETTSYGGAVRGFSVGFSAAGYPSLLGSSVPMADLAASLRVALPLPFSTRHSLVVSVVGRTLPGAPEGALRVGGVGRGLSLSSRRRELPEGPEGLLPAGLTEAVRGYEDYAVRATSAAIAVARYRASFIVDRGTASTLYLFPSFFFRQVDVEVFGSAAVTDTRELTSLRAVGAQLALRSLWGSGLPISLLYQFAWRFDFGLTQLHSVALSFE